MSTTWFSTYILVSMGSNESDTHDSLRKDPNMQPKDDVVIEIHRSPYGCTSAHAHPVDLAVVLIARIGLGLGPKI